jgi:hypothetical protein
MDGGDSDPVAWLDLRASIVEGIRSGLFTGQEVMEELGVSSGTLGRWCRAEDVRGGRRRREAAPSTSPFAAVSLVGRPAAVHDGFVVVLRGGRRVRVAPDFDAGELSRLVRALESC